MKNARLPDGTIISTDEYIPGVHAGKIFCPYCGAKVFYCCTNTSREPFFRTSGKSPESTHRNDCSQKRILAVFNSMKRINNYKPDPKRKNIKQHILQLKIPGLDEAFPGEVNEIGWDHPKKKLHHVNQYSNFKNELPPTARSLKALIRYLKNSDEVLYSTLVKFNGMSYRINELVIDQNAAYELAIKQNTLERFVYGIVVSVVELQTVTFINFERQNNDRKFTAVIFDAKNNPKFTYEKAKLEGEAVLVRGLLRYNSKADQAEITISSDIQLEILK